jgi:phage FluMu protein Com
MRQCPKCQEWNGVDQLKEESVRTIKAGDSAWGKSAGIEGLEAD